MIIESELEFPAVVLEVLVYEVPVDDFCEVLKIRGS